jgi:branched-chain amino acid transport system substrate-binding protein
MNKTIIGIFSLFVVCLFIVGCTQTPTGPTGQVVTNTQAVKTQEPIKFGIIMPLTGDAASIGQSVVNAVNLAAEEINAKGGIDGRKVVILAEDGKCNGKDAVNAMNKLVSVDSIHYMIGAGCSSETLAVVPIAEANKVVMLSPASSNPSITNSGDYIFRDYPSDSFAGDFAAKYIYDGGARTVAIASCQSDYCTAIGDVFAKKFKQLGGKVVFNEQFPMTTTDMKTILSKIKDVNPDMIYMPSYTESTILAFKQAKELGIPSDKFFGGDAWDDPKIWTSTSGFSDGAKYTLVGADVPQEFKQKYVNKYGPDMALTLGATQGYDALYVFKKVIEQAGDNPEAVKTALYDVQNYHGYSGTISFDSNGDLKESQYSVMTIKNGKAVKE